MATSNDLRPVSAGNVKAMYQSLTARIDMGGGLFYMTTRLEHETVR